MEHMYEEFIRILKSELIIALGCTEPGSVAFCVSAAASQVEKRIRRIKVLVSTGIFKNGVSATIPNTGRKGLSVAAALGGAVAKPEKELMILNDITKEDLKEMNRLLDNNAVSVEPVETKDLVFVEAWVKDIAGNIGHAIVSGSHNNISLLEKNGETVDTYDILKIDEKAAISIKDMDIDDIFMFSENVPLHELDFLSESIQINWDIATFGITHENGLNIGKTIKENIDGSIFADDFANYACIMTTAAVDVRMGGNTIPAMACGGSGNQGILASVPIIAIARKKNMGDDILLRSLALSYLVTIYAKEYLGKLSVLCGCSTSAGVGCAAGLTFLIGGDRKQIKGAIQNLLAGLSGMICDGAKESCALKIMNSVTGIIQSSLLAMQGVIVSTDDGIIGLTEEETITNLKSVSRYGMANADTVIIGIMRQKFKEECVKK